MTRLVITLDDKQYEHLRQTSYVTRQSMASQIRELVERDMVENKKEEDVNGLVEKGIG